jgi:hypothetical protein
MGRKKWGNGTVIIGYEQIHRIQKHIGWGMRPGKGSNIIFMKQKMKLC